MTVANRRRISAINRPSVASPQFPVELESSPSSESPINQESFYAVRHLQFPNVPFTNDLINEFILFVYTIACSTLQYIHLYRKNNFTKYPIHHHLIDRNIGIFIIVFSCRRLLFSVLEQITLILCPKKYMAVAIMALKITLTSLLIGLLTALTYKIYVQYMFWCLVVAMYPLVLYLILFRLRLDPLLKMTSSDGTFMNGFPVHSCSMNASMIRAEIETLKDDYNNRFKQMIFTSCTCAYFSCFIPLCFAYSHMYYDTLWATQHLTFAFFGYFLMMLIFCFPAKYSDVMHRASLHIGCWNKVSTRNHPPPLPWNKTIIWPYGSYVKYAGDVWKSNSMSTCATPSNSSHWRFYFLFKNPSNFYSVFTIIQAVIVVVQLLLLASFSNFWENILSLGILIIFNLFILYRLLRDYMISKHIYAGEMKN